MMTAHIYNKVFLIYRSRFRGDVKKPSTLIIFIAKRGRGGSYINAGLMDDRLKTSIDLDPAREQQSHFPERPILDAAPAPCPLQDGHLNLDGKRQYLRPSLWHTFIGWSSHPEYLWHKFWLTADLTMLKGLGKRSIGRIAKLAVSLTKPYLPWPTWVYQVNTLYSLYILRFGGVS